VVQNLVQEIVQKIVQWLKVQGSNGPVHILPYAKNIYANTFSDTSTIKMIKSQGDKCTFSINAILALSRTAITPKFKMRWFSNEGRY